MTNDHMTGSALMGSSVGSSERSSVGSSEGSRNKAEPSGNSTPLWCHQQKLKPCWRLQPWSRPDPRLSPDKNSAVWRRSAGGTWRTHSGLTFFQGKRRTVAHSSAQFAAEWKSAAFSAGWCVFLLPCCCCGRKVGSFRTGWKSKGLRKKR